MVMLPTVIYEIKDFEDYLSFLYVINTIKWHLSNGNPRTFIEL